MKKISFIAIFFVMIGISAIAAIPHPAKYEWGTIEVAENYQVPGGQKLQIYWEKLKAMSQPAKAIVIINGGPGMSHDSLHQATQNGFKHDYFEALRTHYDIYYFDQRGTGKSNELNYANLRRRNYRTYCSSDISRDIEQLRLKVIKKKQIAVLGESYGGMVALTYAIMFPDAVEKLVIHDSSPSNAYFTQMHINFSNGLSNLDNIFPGVKQDMITSVEMFNKGEVSNAHGYTLNGNDFLTLCIPYTYQFEGQYLMALMAAQIVAEGRSDILDAILGPAQRTNERASYSTLPAILALVQTVEMLDMNEINSAGESSPWSKVWAMERILQPRIDFKADYRLNDFNGFNRIPQLGQIKAPTLVIVGETDFICPPEYAHTMNNAIPDSRLLVVKNAAHGGFVEQAEFVLGKIRSFLLNVREEGKIIPASQLTRNSRQNAQRIWLEGVRRLGVSTRFINSEQSE
jgi:pimeloyl-ACP methyl ester carboxylesterase